MIRCFAILAGLLAGWNSFADTFRVATYNVENYLDQPTESRPYVKSDAAKAKIRETVLTMQPDVLALEEMGSTNALLELRAALKIAGLDFPFWEHITGADTGRVQLFQGFIANYSIAEGRGGCGG